MNQTQADERSPLIGIHLDLKYLMPDKGYLERWVRELPSLGLNTLLIEYEDKFPFRKYPFLSDDDAFTPEELERFLRAARAAGLTVIPLVQTLSHLEFALGHEALAHLREAPHIPTQLDTSSPEAVRFACDLVEEVLAYHRPDDYFHVGGDEAWHLGHNVRSAAELERLGKMRYWAQHMRKVIAPAQAAGKTPIVWDDAGWNSPERVAALDLPDDTRIMAWNHGARSTTDRWFERLAMYRNAGYRVIGAGCANWGVLVPNTSHCLANTQTWAERVRDSDIPDFINTAWACFHTPLPTQIPFVAATAQAATGGNVTQPAWLASFLEHRYGCCGQRLSAAVRALGRNWELNVGLDRPITPIVYGYMDMLLHFGSNARRNAIGHYPLDWEEIDFEAIFDGKIKLMRDPAQRACVRENLDELTPAYERAARELAAMAAQAGHDREEIILLATLARMKAACAQLLRVWVLDEEGLEAPVEAWAALEQELASALAPFYEPKSIARLKRIWWQPIQMAIERTLTGAQMPAHGHT